MFHRYCIDYEKRKWSLAFLSMVSESGSFIILLDDDTQSYTYHSVEFPSVVLGEWYNYPESHHAI